MTRKYNRSEIRELYDEKVFDDELWALLNKVLSEDLHKPPYEDTDYEDIINRQVEAAKQNLRVARELRRAEIAVETMDLLLNN